MKTIRIADIKPNDVVDGEGICVSVWLQGCPHHCKGCHNPETWNFDGGIEYEQDMLIFQIIKTRRYILTRLTLRIRTKVFRFRFRLTAVRESLMQGLTERVIPTRPNLK